MAVHPLTSLPSDLHAAATAWRDDDPDESTRTELDTVLTEAAAGDPAALADLIDRFAGTLEFGTAGLRGRIGAGPNRMNRAVVIRAAAGLTAYLQAQRTAPRVVIGYDARHRSADFARDTAAVVTAAGGEALLLPGPLPTPVLAFAIRHLRADAGVMVTASHNPPQDNGYKVYLGDGSQIVPPSDTEIAARIAALGPVLGVPRADDGWLVLDDTVLDAYLDAVAAVVAPGSAREVNIVHTPCTGSAGTRCWPRSSEPGSCRPMWCRARVSRTRTFPRSRSPIRRSPALSTPRSPSPRSAGPTW